MSTLLNHTSKSKLKEIRDLIKKLSKEGKRYYLSMDTETTGLSGELDRLVSLGAVLLDENGNKIEEFELFFDPMLNDKDLEKRYLNSTAEKITKLTPKTLRGQAPLMGTDVYLSSPAVQFSEIADDLNEIFSLPNIVKVAHNAPFDMRMMDKQFSVEGLHYFNTKDQIWLDSQPMAKKLFDSNPEFKEKQLNVLAEINKGRQSIDKLTLNTLDSLDMFLSEYLGKPEFNRTIGGKEMHGALLDSLMLAEVLNKYKEGFREEFDETMRKITENEVPVHVKSRDLISFNVKTGTIPVIRTSGSAPTDPKTLDVAVSSVRTEDLAMIFENLIESGVNQVVISDFNMIANMMNIEKELIKFNEKQKEEGKPQMEAIMGISSFLIDERGFKSEVDFIPKTAKDFEQVTRIQQMAFENDSINPHILVSNLGADIFENMTIVANGYKDIIQKDKDTEEEVVEYFKNILSVRPDFKLGVYETLKELNDKKYNIVNKLKEVGVNMDILGTSPITYTDLGVHRIQEESITKEGVKYRNIADFVVGERSYFKNEGELPFETYATTNAEKLLPRNEVGIPNPFEYSLTFLKDNVPVIWNKVEDFGLIDETKPLEEQDIDHITEEYVKKGAIEGLKQRAKENNWSDEYLKENLEAAEKELDVIGQMGFYGFTAFVQYFTEGEIKGKGRGSAAGSVVSYGLRITDIPPLENGLLFERYLNLLRKGLPDIDMDFADRNDVISRKLGVFEKVEKDFTKYILTLSTAGIKSAVAEVCKRSSDFELYKTGLMEGYSGKGSKSVYVSKQLLGKYFETPGTKLNDVLGNPDYEEFNNLYETNEYVRRIIDISAKREGVITGFGVHAAGVILKTTLENYLNYGPIINGVATTPMGGKDVEEMIGIKMDFLGLNALQLIESIKSVIEKTQGKKALEGLEYVLENYGSEMLQDKGILNLVQEINTSHIFQYGSDLMKQIMKEINIQEEDDVLEMLAIISAIGRPGVDSETFIKNKNDPENNMKLMNDYPELEPILGKTAGVIVYEEQIMSIFKDLFGYNMGEAGVIQKQVGKKKGLDELREEILERKPNLIGLFDYIVDNAGYSFNKSHAISYAVTSMMMMYLKANYKKEFFVGYLNNKIAKKDDVPSLLNDMKKEFNSVDISGIDINKSSYKTMLKDDEIIMGLGFIKGVGKSAAYRIIQEREKNGEYKSIEDVVNRLKSAPSAKDALSGILKSEIRNEKLKKHIDGYIFTNENLTMDQLEEKLGHMGDYPELFSMLERETFDKKDQIKNLLKGLKKVQKNIDLELKSAPKTGKDWEDNVARIESLKKEYEKLNNFLNGFSTGKIKKELERLAASKEFGDISDVVERLKEETVNMKTTLTKVALTGAFDSLSNNPDSVEGRKEILGYIELNTGKSSNKMTYTLTELLSEEKELTGGYLHLAHPLDNEDLKSDMYKQGYRQISKIKNLKKDRSTVKFYGLVSDLERRVSANGNDMFRGTVTDEFGEEQFVLGMVKSLDEKSIKALSQDTLPLKLEGQISINENTEDKTIFISDAETLQIDGYKANDQKTSKDRVNTQSSNKMVENYEIHENPDGIKAIIEVNVDKYSGKIEQRGEDKYLFGNKLYAGKNIYVNNKTQKDKLIGLLGGQTKETEKPQTKTVEAETKKEVVTMFVIKGEKGELVYKLEETSQQKTKDINLYKLIDGKSEVLELLVKSEGVYDSKDKLKGVLIAGRPGKDLLAKPIVKPVSASTTMRELSSFDIVEGDGLKFEKGKKYYVEFATEKEESKRIHLDLSAVQIIDILNKPEGKTMKVAVKVLTAQGLKDKEVTIKKIYPEELPAVEETKKETAPLNTKPTNNKK